MKLYYDANTRANRPRWLLEEIGAPYQLCRLDRAAGEHKRPEYLAIHPLGKVPALVDGDLVIFESAAICMHLADRFPEAGLAPPVGTPARALYYQWIAFAVAEVEPAVADVWYRREPRQTLAAVAPAVAAAVRGREFLVGDRFSAADVVMGGVLGWAKLLGLLDDQPELLAYFRRLAPRPAFKRARAD